jgi:hypothetical protein
MKKISKLIVRWFPDIPGWIWVDTYSAVALYRFAKGLPVDATTLGVVLGAFVIHQVATSDSKDGSKADA